MATADRILALKLIGDVASIDKSLKSTQGRLRSTAAAAGSWVKAAGIGLAIEGVGQLTNALGEAWGGFREGEKAAAQLGTTWDNFNVKGADLQETIDRIGASTLKLGTDDVEAMNAFNKALQATGGAPAQAMNRLRIAQDLVANGSAPNLASAMKLIQGAANGSKKVVDQFGLTAETAGGRVRQLGRRVKGAAEAAAEADIGGVFSNAFAEGLEGAVGALASGDLEGALASIAGIGTAAAAAWTGVFPAIDTAMTGLIGEEQWGKVKSVAQGALDAVAETVVRVGLIWDGLAPHVQNMVTLVQPLVEGLATFVGLAGENIGLVLDAIGAALSGDFTAAWEAIEGVVGNVGTAVFAIITSVQTFLEGILPGIAGFASSIGTAIFDGITGAISGLAARVSEIFNAAVTAIRDAWNSLDFSIPAFNLKWDGISVPNPAHGTIFDVFGTPNVSVLGAGNFNVWAGTGDLIPDFAEGGIVKARPGGLIGRIAEAGRDEAIIPLDRMGGMGGGQTINVTINVGPASDPVAVGREVVRVLRAYANGGGRLDIRGVVNG